MLKELYQLELNFTEYDNIYIYGINKDSIDTMLVLCARGIEIKGFVSNESEYIGQSILNKDIYSLECIFSSNDLCIVPTHEKRIPLGIQIKCIRYSDIHRKMVLDDLDNEVSIYGAGASCYKLIDLLSEKKINVSKVYTSTIPEKKYILQKPIIVWNNDIIDENAIIISVENEKFVEEVLLKLHKCKNDIYIISALEKTIIIQGNNFVLSLDHAIKENRNIVFVDENNFYSRYYENILNINKIKYQKVTPEVLISNNMCLTKSCIVINIFDASKRCDVIEFLYQKGMRLEKFDFTSLFYVTGNRVYIEGKSYSVPDALTGVCINHLGEDTVGLKILCRTRTCLKCNLKVKPLRLLVLGNSTSQHGLFPFKSWPEMLFDMLKDKYDLSIYNASTSSDDVVNEYLRLIRDFHSIKPDIVISFSGLTNLYNENIERQFNVSTQYNANIDKVFGKGILDNRTHYDFWLQIQNMIQDYCQQNGADYLGVLQPINCYMPSMSLYERMQFDLSKKYVGAVNFYENMNNESIYINLLDIFFHKHDMYVDLSHYSQEANSVIAEIMYEEIIRIEERRNK